MGYANNSPYRNNPYLDIKTPEGLITMENTDIDLIGIDNLGNVKQMKAGRKNPYKFEGDMVREIPMKAGGLSISKAKEMLKDGTANGQKLTKKQVKYFQAVAHGWKPKKQQGGNPYTSKQIFDFIFDDEVEDEKVKNIPTAPTVEEILPPETTQTIDPDYEMAMEIAMRERQNPYRQSKPYSSYTGKIYSSGEFGDKNVGDYGRQIYGKLASDLGYSPTVNSIYRSSEQQAKLVKQGVGVKNSWHLTGNAIDLSPKDWHKLTDEQQLYYRQNYDVVQHNNHYHIEPK